MVMRRLLSIPALSLALSACSDSTEPSEAGLLGCHVLAASELSNGAPARRALVRMDRENVQVIGDVTKATTAGYESGSWSLEDGPALRFAFGSGFVGVTYTFTAFIRGEWYGEVEFWVDTPTLNGTGAAILRPTRCP